MARLREMPVFADGPLAAREPELKVRRARRRPNRLGFAVPAQFRLSVTAYPGIRPGDVLETLLHELVHLHVGRAAEPHAWHGKTFKAHAGAGDGRGLRDRRPEAREHDPRRLRRGDRVEMASLVRPREVARAVAPIELFFDLVYVPSTYSSASASSS